MALRYLPPCSGENSRERNDYPAIFYAPITTRFHFLLIFSSHQKARNSHREFAYGNFCGEENCGNKKFGGLLKVKPLFTYSADLLTHWP